MIDAKPENQPPRAETDTNVIVEFRHVHKWFDDFHVLRDINMIVGRGEKVVVCGPSGSGKSTLIRDLLKPVVSYLAKERLDGISGPKFARLGRIDWDGNAGAGPPFRQVAVGTGFRQVIEVTQSPIGKTPRSTA